jgi:hypothetical protein
MATPLSAAAGVSSSTERRPTTSKTPPFPPVRLGRNEYYVLGDNRTFSQDSRDFGPVPRDAIFARTFLVAWPPGRLGVPVYDKDAIPRGDAPC